VEVLLVRKWIYLTVLVLLVLTLAVGGWAAAALRATARPLRPLLERGKEAR
jgi:hypothetical protein